MRKDELVANETTLEFKRRARELWLGGEDENGDFIPGYASTQGKDASQGYAGFENAINQLRQDMFAALPNKDTGARFLSKTTSSHSAYLDSAAQHAATGTRAWEGQQLAELEQAFLVDLNDKANDPQTMGTMLQDFVGQRVQEGKISPDKLGEYEQGMYVKIGKYFANQPKDASAQLGTFIDSFGERFDIDTQTALDSTLITVTDRENRYAEQLERDRERAEAKREKAYDKDLRARVEKGEMIDWQDEAVKVIAGAGGSWSAYYAMKDRHENGERYPAIDPIVERQLRANLLAGRADADDIDIGEWDNASKRRLNNFLEAVQNDRTGKQTQLMLPRIESIVKGKVAPGNDEDIAILNAQNSFINKVATGMDPDAAFGEVTRSYISASTEGSQLTPITYEGSSHRPHSREAADMHLETIIRKLEQGEMDPAEAEQPPPRLGLSSCILKHSITHKRGNKLCQHYLPISMTPNVRT